MLKYSGNDIVNLQPTTSLRHVIASIKVHKESPG